MAKHQVNVRISNLTRDKLVYLSEHYGTQAEAMAVAIDRLYRETRYGYGDDALPGEGRAAGGFNGDDLALSDHDGERIRVLVVDDEQHVRENIIKLALMLGAEVVGAAATGEEGIELARKLQPHIVLMGRLMPGMDGLAASQIITEMVPYTRIIMTAVQGAESLRRSMLAGARDCLSRPFNQYERKFNPAIAAREACQICLTQPIAEQVEHQQPVTLSFEGATLLGNIITWVDTPYRSVRNFNTSLLTHSGFTTAR